MKCDYCKKPIRSKTYIKNLVHPAVYLHVNCWDAWDEEHDMPKDQTNKDK